MPKERRSSILESKQALSNDGAHTSGRIGERRGNGELRAHDDFRNIHHCVILDYGSGMGWKYKLELWPYLAIAISVIGFLYLILARTR
jgi:hypothetical protein